MKAFAMLAALTLAAGTAQAGMLVNQSFEAGSQITWKNWATDNVEIPGWRASVNTGANSYASWSVWDDASVAGVDGTKRFQITAGVFQTSAAARPAAIPGTKYHLDYLTRLDDNVWESSTVYIDFFSDNTGYTPIASSSQGVPNRSSVGTGGAMRAYGFDSIEAPAGTTSIGVRVVQRAANYNWAESYDNFNLTAVPEPTTLGLVAGAMMLLTRRMRKA